VSNCHKVAIIVLPLLVVNKLISYTIFPLEAESVCSHPVWGKMDGVSSVPVG